jgi:hypothetical protein
VADYRVLVTGSREWAELAPVWGPLKDACDTHGTDRIIIVHGGARGADALAAEYASTYGMRSEPHPARWHEFGKSAGFRRNAEMVALGADLCLAFYKQGAGNKGTDHCAKLAEAAGIPVRRITG